MEVASGLSLFARKKKFMEIYERKAIYIDNENKMWYNLYVLQGILHKIDYQYYTNKTKQGIFLLSRRRN